MRVIAHLSDLHFGRVHAEALEPLERRLAQLKPDLVVVSGDLTQRARAWQFREARAFLERLPKPQLVVPGNHDVPLFNLFARFLRPLAGYRGIISQDVEPGFADEEITVLGVNTARSLTWKSGRVSEAQRERIRTEVSRAGAMRTTVLVTHHPFVLHGCHVDLFVSGHCHRTTATADGAVVVGAGTATSRRTREEPNAFNLLRVAPQRIDVEHHVLRSGGFVRAAMASFGRDENGWARIGPE